MSVTASYSLIKATRTAVDDAARLGLERPVENLVAEARAAGRMRRNRTRDEALFFIEGGLVAIAGRSASTLTGRTSWLVKRVRVEAPW